VFVVWSRTPNHTELRVIFDCPSRRAQVVLAQWPPFEHRRDNARVRLRREAVVFALRSTAALTTTPVERTDGALRDGRRELVSVQVWHAQTNDLAALPPQGGSHTSDRNGHISGTVGPDRGPRLKVSL
jgi:hypothetical protein